MKAIIVGRALPAMAGWNQRVCKALLCAGGTTSICDGRLELARPTSVFRLSGLILLLCLSACTSFIDPIQTDRDTHQQQLAELQDWELRGRLNIRSEAESRTVNLRWLQNHTLYDINLSGALGMGTVQIHGDDQHLVLESSNEPPQYLDDLSQLGEAYLGYAFPAEHLLYWVKGGIAPDSPFEAEYNELGLLASLQQDGWELEYERYQRVGDINLPGLIRMQHPRYRLIFQVGSWTPGAAP